MGAGEIFHTGYAVEGWLLGKLALRVINTLAPQTHPSRSQFRLALKRLDFVNLRHSSQAPCAKAKPSCIGRQRSAPMRPIKQLAANDILLLSARANRSLPRGPLGPAHGSPGLPRERGSHAPAPMPAKVRAHAVAGQ